MSTRGTAGERNGRRGVPLVLRIFAIGFVTAVGIAYSWFTAHRYIHFQWAKGAAVGQEIIRDLPSHWASSGMQDSLDRIRRNAGVLASIYDAQGALIATNVRPPFAAPTRAEQQRALSEGTNPRFFGHVVIPVRDGGRLLGFCVFHREMPEPPFWGVMMDLFIISTWISVVGLLVWRTLGRPLQRIARAAEAFGSGDMSARTGVVRSDEIGLVARAFDEMSERIARSREAERELLAGLSHELRTPLARIRVALDLAAEGDAQTARTSLADVSEDLTELETLIGNIFSTTRLEMAARGRGDQPVPLHRAEVDLGELLEKAVAHQRTVHPERPYALAVCDQAAPRRIYADAVLIRRAIENVLDNAHKYSPPGSPVNINVTAAPNALHVAIRDWGFGIRPDDLQRVFSPFFRADRSRTRATGGVGLGLALAKRVVEAHGGGIDVASEIDAGTTVTFRLPIVDPARSTGARRAVV